MTDTSKSYKQLGIPHFREVFEIIDRVLVARGYLTISSV